VSSVIPKTIALVGLMGAGKTSVGRRLAQRFSVPFVDADHEIEAAAGCTIAEFFDKYGESEFRKGEKRVIARILSNEPCILATGGGAFMSLETRKCIRKTAISLWLRAELDVLKTRLSGRSGRPLLKTPNLDETLKALINERYPVYSEADLVVDSNTASLDETVDNVFKTINKFFYSGIKSELS
tara:strand:- start:430 stop:981 length:552 start_codon:yes stop_codon:yes gene_type:complete